MDLPEKEFFTLSEEAAFWSEKTGKIITENDIADYCAQGQHRADVLIATRPAIAYLPKQEMAAVGACMINGVFSFTREALFQAITTKKFSTDWVVPGPCKFSISAWSTKRPSYFYALNWGQWSPKEEGDIDPRQMNYRLELKEMLWSPDVEAWLPAEILRPELERHLRSLGVEPGFDESNIEFSFADLRIARYNRYAFGVRHNLIDISEVPAVFQATRTTPAVAEQGVSKEVRSTVAKNAALGRHAPKNRLYREAIETARREYEAGCSKRHPAMADWLKERFDTETVTLSKARLLDELKKLLEEMSRPDLIKGRKKILPR